MDVQKLKTQYATLISQAKSKAGEFTDGPISKEAGVEIDRLLGQADELKAQIELAGRLAGAHAYANEPVGPQAAHLGWREAGPTEGETPVDLKAWREVEVPQLTRHGIEAKKIRYHVPLAVQRKGYEPAFEAYLRKGLAEMGPSDRKALSEALDSAGGYTVPEAFQAQLIKKLATMATVRQFARVISTSRDIVRWPRVKYATDNEYTSGVRLTWTGEIPAASTTARVTDQVFGEFSIPINTAMASQLVSMDLVEDSAFDILGVSAELFAEAFALGENAAFWSGSGAGRPRGILVDAADTVNFDAAVQTGATANTIASDEVIDIAYAVPSQYEINARWFMTKATEKAVRKLTDTDGFYLWPVQAGSNLAAAPRELLGFPLVRDEFVDDISDATNTTTYPLVFGDLSGYVIADRVGLSIKRDENLYAETNQVLLLGRKRVGGQLVEAYRLSLLKTVNST